ncbi:MAG TPA: hypothetical protein VMW45_00400 [Dehalococcoidia bacterium]|nr:hypothetical protein [Dehalococcoidia bacterium]
MSDKNAYIILPTLNEEKTVGKVIDEIPIHYRRRPTPAKLSSIKDGLKIGWTLITRRFR